MRYKRCCKLIATGMYLVRDIFRTKVKGLERLKKVIRLFVRNKTFTDMRTRFGLLYALEQHPVLVGIIEGKKIPLNPEYRARGYLKI